MTSNIGVNLKGQVLLATGEEENITPSIANTF